MDAPRPSSAAAASTCPLCLSCQASLQDYSYQIGRMVTLTPAQFCRSAEHHQRQRRLGTTLQPQLLAKPTIYEADDDFSLTNPMVFVREPFLVKVSTETA